MSRILKKVIRFLNRIYLKTINKPIGVIYMLHRVYPFEEGKLLPNESMKVSPEYLDYFITKIRNDYEFVSLDEVYEIVEKKKRLKKKFVVFTLDDGYLDNYTIAAPIFIKYKIPFTIYVATDFPDKNAFLWWYILEDMLIRNDKIILSNGQCYNCSNYSEKVDSFMKIRKIILELPTKNFKAHFDALLGAYDYPESKYSNDLMMSWLQIKELSTNPLCTIGAHTITHRRLSELQKDDMKYEIGESKKILEKKLGINISHFSYPYGTQFEVDNQVIETTKLFNFKTATLGEGGVIRRFDKDTHRLKRTILKQE